MATEIIRIQTKRLVMKNLLFALALLVASSMLSSADKNSQHVYPSYEDAWLSCEGIVSPYYSDEDLIGYICIPHRTPRD